MDRKYIKISSISDHMTNLFRIPFALKFRPPYSHQILIQLTGKRYMKKKKQMPNKLNKNNKNNVVNAKSNDCKRSYRFISRLVDVVSEFVTVNDT